MHARRGLHQPFFPLASSSPPPGESPLSFAAPELPFFFPVYSSPLPPPPQPPAAVVSHPTFPASVSSLAGPPPTSFRDYKPAIAVLLALLALLAAAAAMYFFYRRRLLCWFDKEGARSDSQRLFDCVASDGGAAPKSSPRVSSVFGSKLWSPELRPIPWLPRHTRGRGEEKAVEDSSGREFYSPRPSSAWKGSSGRWESGRISSSQRTLPAAVAERCESRSSALDTPPYLSSPLVSSARFASSPGHSSRRSLRSTSERISPGDCCVTTPPPPLETLSAKTKVATFDLYTHRQRQNGVPRAPPPPPPPPAGYWERQVLRPPTTQPNNQMTISDGREKNEDATRPKLKPLHWDKLPASSNRAMVWDQLKSSSFRVNEEAMETLFVCNTTKEMNKVLQVLPLPPQATTVLDPKRSQNIAILLRSLNSTKEEVCEALLEGNAERLETEQLEILLKMAPNQEEENKLKEYKDDSSPFNLGPEEKFLKALLDIPFPFKRAEAMLFMATFDSEVNFLNKSFLTLETACEELRSSRLFLKLLEAVLKTGNRMNIGTNRGGARAFKLDTLLKLVDIKSNDGKTTLLHFVTEEVIRSEGDSFPSATSNVAVSALERRKLGLQAVAGLAQELCNVKAAAAMDSDALDSYVSKLAGGYGKINEVLRLNEALGREEYRERFHEAMYESMRRAEEGIIKVQAQESAAMSVVKETTDYFHGDSAKEEAHPLR